MKKVIASWLKNEDGFEVFEKFGLTQGGVILAMGVVAVGVYFMSQLWNGVSGQLGTSGLGNINPAGLSDYQAQGWIQ